MKIGDEGGQERILKRFLHTMYDPFANPISATPKYPNSRLTEPLCHQATANQVGVRAGGALAMGW